MFRKRRPRHVSDKEAENTFLEKVKLYHFDTLQYKLCEIGEDSHDPFVYGCTEKDKGWIAYRTDEKGEHDAESFYYQSKKKALDRLFSFLNYEAQAESVLRNLCGKKDNDTMPISHKYRDRYKHMADEEFESFEYLYGSCSYTAEWNGYPGFFEYSLAVCRVKNQWLILRTGERCICEGGIGPFKNREEALITLLDELEDTRLNDEANKKHKKTTSKISINAGV